MFDLQTYHKAGSVEEAIALLAANPDSRLLAGGTDILIKLRHGKSGFAELIDIHGLAELRSIRKDAEENILIGSGTTFTDIIESKLLQRSIPMLCDAAQSVGGPQIRNMATIGGNICNGVTSADSAPGLFGLNALLQIHGPDGLREVPVAEFYLGPGKVDLRRGDVLVAFKITPENYAGSFGYYYKYAMRDAMDIATIGCAVSLKTAASKVSDYRIAFGVAGPTPIRCPKTEQAVLGRELSAELFDCIAEVVIGDVNPRTSWRAAKDFRLNIIQELAKRATHKALQRALHPAGQKEGETI
ncbi:xanthine dehydrogenase FAD-binding subunit XdhB [Desulfopila sp. IMCC35006]|uniref:xanthine dehydrogenase subunit XdhB n=1 Tax=Desulfopila sp. IMCC35006 TaxID=2569542 RepID=UPI0010AD18BA|nr:xanthine dehydrogenase subunit XdhB [Desulfopila sp. IMCC35006]TKB28628.1 xanthine dehydrogenase FAD-binding subunit XdhB [Desulfopila sp. IMCC35006]